jgi:hypothetical protein
VQTISRRALSARKNGKLGGLSTAAKATEDFLKLRAQKAGSATRDKYGVDYYRYLRTRNRQVKPSITSTVKQIQEVAKELTSVQMMRQATESLGI